MAILSKRLILKNSKTKVTEGSVCKTCGAPYSISTLTMAKDPPFKYKVCSSLSQLHPRHRNKARYFCPHCGHSLYLWKERKDISIYKYDNNRCPCFLNNKVKLNCKERILAKLKTSQFKLRYQYRKYHFTLEEMKYYAPKEKDFSSFLKIYNTFNTLCIALAFHISLGISASVIFTLELIYFNSVLQRCRSGPSFITPYSLIKRFITLP